MAKKKSNHFVTSLGSCPTALKIMKIRSLTFCVILLLFLHTNRQTQKNHILRRRSSLESNEIEVGGGLVYW